MKVKYHIPTVYFFHVNLMLFNGVVAIIWQKLMNLVIDVQRKKNAYRT